MRLVTALESYNQTLPQLRAEIYEKDTLNGFVVRMYKNGAKLNEVTLNNVSVTYAEDLAENFVNGQINLGEEAKQLLID